MVVYVLSYLGLKELLLGALSLDMLQHIFFHRKTFILLDKLCLYISEGCFLCILGFHCSGSAKEDGGATPILELQKGCHFLG